MISVAPAGVICLPETARESNFWSRHKQEYFLQANKQQQRAIAHNTGPALILAGPGSGKTFTTVERVRYLIEVHHADPSHILVITFTKAAARQMRDRFFARMDNQFNSLADSGQRFLFAKDFHDFRCACRSHLLTGNRKGIELLEQA